MKKWIFVDKNDKGSYDIFIKSEIMVKGKGHVSKTFLMNVETYSEAKAIAVFWDELKDHLL